MSPLNPPWTKVGWLLVSEGFCKTSECIWFRSIGIEPEPSTACVFSWEYAFGGNLCVYIEFNCCVGVNTYPTF